MHWGQLVAKYWRKLDISRKLVNVIRQPVFVNLCWFRFINIRILPSHEDWEGSCLHDYISKVPCVKHPQVVEIYRRLTSPKDEEFTITSFLKIRLYKMRGQKESCLNFSQVEKNLKALLVFTTLSPPPTYTPQYRSPALMFSKISSTANSL